MAAAPPTTSAKKASTNSTTGPMLKKPPRRGKVPCGVCQGAIVDGKDEALLCEGDCGLWYHRGCASIPPAQYKSLSNSTDPFICLACTNIHLRREITQLKNELAITTDVRDKYLALAAEVTTLRQVVDSLVKDAKSSSKSNVRPNHPTKRSYASAVTTASTIPMLTTSKPTANRQSRQQNLLDSSKSASGESNKSRIKVAGARKIWGTVPTCSAGAVAATISKLVPTKLQLRIRRKTKASIRNKVVWWFVVHGTESDLVILERDWEKVQMQTLWSLENCYMPSLSTTQSEDLPGTHTENVTQSSPATTHTSDRASSNQQSPASTAAPHEQQPPNPTYKSVDESVVITDIHNTADKASTNSENTALLTPSFRTTPTSPPHT